MVPEQHKAPASDPLTHGIVVSLIVVTEGVSKDMRIVKIKEIYFFLDTDKRGFQFCHVLYFIEGL
jgi:hypothetical protein